MRIPTMPQIKLPNPAEWANSAATSFMNTISDAFQEFLKGIVTSMLDASYDICLIIGLIGLILYIFGYRKGKNYPLISTAMYLIINIIGRALLNV